MKKILFTILANFLIGYLFGQYDNGDITKVYTTPPTEAALGKYIDYPVGLHSGVPQISIPLYTIKTGDYTMPITLSYHASGIKVQEQASWVGLGWSLNAGGVITRVINGKGDDKNYCAIYNGKVGIMNKAGLLYGATPEEHEYDFSLYDNESDSYYFNFCGHLGKFFFDSLGNIHLEDDQPYKISFSPSLSELRSEADSSNEGITKFVITTDDGIIYTFDKQEYNYNIPTEPYWIDAPLFNYYDDQYHEKFHFYSQSDSSLHTLRNTMAWYLTKIEFPNGSNSINLGYTPVKYTDLERTGMHRTYTNCHMTNSDYCHFNYNLILYDWSLTLIHGFRLNSISWGNGSVSFKTSKRKDVDTNSYDDKSDYNLSEVLGYNGGEEKLDEITVKDNNNAVKKIIKLKYSYFKDDTAGLYKILLAEKSFLHYRLKLLSVYDSAVDGKTSQPYIFEYRDTKMPFRYSNAIDFWGYYNGKESNTNTIPAIYIYPQAYFNKKVGYRYEPGGIDTTLFRSIYFPVPVGRYDVQKEVNYGPGTTASSFTIGSDRFVFTITDNIPDSHNLWWHYNDYVVINKRKYPDGIGSDEAHDSITLVTNEDATNRHITIKGADRRVTTGEENQAYILKKITYPTGGDTKFTYETNVFRLKGVPGDTMLGGGVRIKKIEAYDPVNHNTITKTYKYLDNNGNCSGRILDFPLFVAIHCWDYDLRQPEENLIRDSLRTKYDFAAIYGQENTEWVKFYLGSINPERLIMYSNSKTELGTFQGSYVGYKNVTVEYNGNGREEYVYDLPVSIDNRKNDEPGIYNKFYNNGSGYIIPDLGYGSYYYYWISSFPKNTSADFYPFLPAPYSDWDRGQLLSKTVFDENGDIIQKTENYYTIGKYSTFKQIRRSYVPPIEPGTIMFSPYYTPYNKISAYKYLDEQDVTTYDPLDASKKITATTNYIYNDEHLPVQVTRSRSDGKQEVTKILYPKDYLDSPGFINDMVDANVISKPVETVKYIPYKGVVAGEVNEYYPGGSAGKYSLYKTWKLHLSKPLSETDFRFSNQIDPGIPSWNAAPDNSYDKSSLYTDPEITIDTYDSYGNLLQYHKEDDINVSYFWGYDNAYPIIKAENVSSSVLESAAKDVAITNYGVEDLEEFVNIIYPTLTKSLLKEFNGYLRSNASLQGAMITTYTYDPLVGMTSMTDENNITTYYEYDSFGRLQNIKDNDGNILKQYDYHYKGQ